MKSKGKKGNKAKIDHTLSLNDIENSSLNFNQIKQVYPPFERPFLNDEDLDNNQLDILKNKNGKKKMKLIKSSKYVKESKVTPVTAAFESTNADEMMQKS